MPDFSFKKAERLTSSKSISYLFKEGRSLSSYPVRILFNTDGTGDYPLSVAISVPKRLYKRAVDRNLLKRRLREVYRLNKNPFHSRLERLNIKANLVIQYQHKEILDYGTIEGGVLKGLEKMLSVLETQI